MNEMKSLYAGTPKNPPAYCQYHHCVVTVAEMKRHRCLQKQCPLLQRNEAHSYWEQRERKKQQKKATRAAFKAKLPN